MQKNVSGFIIVCSLSLLLACSKKHEPVTTGNNNALPLLGQPIFYSITGFRDVSVKVNLDTVISMPISVHYYPSNVALNVDIFGLPDGVTVTPKSVSGFNSFDTTFLFTVKMDSPGVFPVVIATYGNSGKYTSESGYKFNITAGQ